MDPITLELLTTIGLSLLVSGCGLAAILVLPWNLDEALDDTPAPRGHRALAPEPVAAHAVLTGC